MVSEKSSAIYSAALGHATNSSTTLGQNYAQFRILSRLLTGEAYANALFLTGETSEPSQERSKAYLVTLAFAEQVVANIEEVRCVFSTRNQIIPEGLEGRLQEYSSDANKFIESVKPKV